MKNREEYGSIEAELWIRSFAPVGGDERQEAAVRRLRELNESGHLADLTVRMWGKAMRRSSPAAYTEEGQVMFDRFDEFSAWADDEDRSLEPFFEEREERCEFTGESDELVVLPSVALAEYREDELVHLAPHTDGDRQVTVQDRIAELAEDPATEGPRQAVPAE